jgi:hypothetical protein
VEARGIERVPSDERTDSSMSMIGTMVCASKCLLVSELAHRKTNILTMMDIVALCQLGRLCFCHWRPSATYLLFGICRYHTHHLLFQHSGDIASMLLLNFWTEVWSEADGIVEVLLRLVRS